MIILNYILTFLAGVALGAMIVLSMELKILSDLMRRCKECEDALEQMRKDEEQWHRDHMSTERATEIMSDNLTGYLRDKYMPHHEFVSIEVGEEE